MTAPRRPLREPTVWFVLTAAVVHVIRQNLVDVLVFLGTAVLILVDARRPTPGRPVRMVRLTPAVAALVCASYALLLLPMARTGWPMRIAVAVPGVVALVVVMRSGHALADGPRRRLVGRGWLAWATLLVAGCLFELYNFVNQVDPQTDSYAHPTISALLDPLLADPVSRALAGAVWLAAGMWLLRVLTRTRVQVSQP